jgi:hypothetical protein
MSMKRVVLMVVLALALPLAAFAGDVDFTNTGGTLTGSSAGLTLTGSALTVVDGIGGLGIVSGADLGSLAFTTGALTSGNLTTGATFAAGGSFTITGNGTGGIPNSVIFSGTFSGPVSWSEVTTPGPNGSIYYILSGAVSGTWYTGATVNGATTQITFSAGKSGFTGSVTLGSGDTIITTTVPEPGTLGMLGTGLVGLAGLSGRMVRAKLKA